MTEDAALGLISRPEAEEIAKDVVARAQQALPTAKVLASLGTSSAANARFARNEILDVSGSEGVQVGLALELDGGSAFTYSDRTDPEGRAALVAEAVGSVRQSRAARPVLIRPPRNFTDPPLFFEASVRAREPAYQGDLIRSLAEMIERAQLTGTGAMRVSARTTTVFNSAGFLGHSRKTYGEVTVNVRTPGGKGSGWSWSGGEDFSKITAQTVGERAVSLAQRSADPVAVEPGRYTVILEPEALAQLMDAVVGGPTESMSYGAAAAGSTVFSVYKEKKRAGTKVGLQLADRRVQLISDPMDRDIPHSPLHINGTIMSRVQWIENGVLRQLSTSDVPNPGAIKLEITGETQTLEEMIASTRRGIWVHRFSPPLLMSPLTLLLTGVTRDGTFLIENGKVTKAVKNLRFSESPFFVLNKIDSFGSAVRASEALACPRLKVRDFEFTALSDAI